jgi:transcriptional regulator with XRE-family HTH domain
MGAMENVIRAYRNRNRLTLKKFGEMVDLSEASISRLERGKQAMTLELADKLSKATGIPAPFWAFPNWLVHPELEEERW